MGGDGDGNVIDLKRRSVVSEVLDDDDVPEEVPPTLRGYAANAAATAKRDAKPVEPEKGEAPPPEIVPPGELPPLPTASTPYEKAHSLLANAPLPTIYFLAEEQLPDGLSYAILERVRMVEPQTPGGSPELLLRFNGSVVTEVRIEGRNLLSLCDLIGRHLIHWVRQYPGRDADDPKKWRVFIRRITFREIK